MNDKPDFSSVAGPYAVSRPGYPDELFEWLDAPVLRIAGSDTPVGYSPPLEEFILPQIPRLVEAIRELHTY